MAEYLFIDDVAWTLDNVTQLKLRPEATMRRIGESGPALMLELTWIKDIMDHQDLIVIPSHDDILPTELMAKQLIGDRLQQSQIAAPGRAPAGLNFWSKARASAAPIAPPDCDIGHNKVDSRGSPPTCRAAPATYGRVDQPEPEEPIMLKRASLPALAAITALASPIAVQAANGGSRTQAQPAPVLAHPAPHVRFPAMNHAPNVTLKRGALGTGD